MRWLQALVVVMSIMIVLGVAIIGATVVHRLSGRSSRTATASTSPQALDPPAPVQMMLKLPSGAHVETVTTTAETVVLRVSTPGQSDCLYIVDPKTGRLLHQIALDAQ